MVAGMHMANGNGTSKGMATIRRMARRIAERFSPDRIILFGSYAKGRPRPGSDADLLVIFRSVRDRRSKAAQIYAHLAGSGMPKDIVVVSRADVERYGDLHGMIIRPALEEGRVLYERSAH